MPKALEPNTGLLTPSALAAGVLPNSELVWVVGVEKNDDFAWVALFCEFKLNRLLVCGC